MRLNTYIEWEPEVLTSIPNIDNGTWIPISKRHIVGLVIQSDRDMGAWVLNLTVTRGLVIISHTTQQAWIHTSNDMFGPGTNIGFGSLYLTGIVQRLASVSGTLNLIGLRRT